MSARFGLIDFKDCKTVLEVDKASEQYLGLSTGDRLMIFRDSLLYSRKTGKILHDQLEIPFPALCWVIDTIENGFCKRPDEGGLPKDVLHAEALIEGEDIYLRRTMNCGAPNQQGYTLKNFSRNSYLSANEYQSVQLPDYLLFEEGLMDELKEIALSIQ